jgi:tight adherence protein C
MMSIDITLLIIVAATSAVFGIASLFTTAPQAAVSSTLLANSGGQALTRHVSWFSNKLMPRNEKELHELRLLLLQAGFESPRAAEDYYATRALVALALAAVLATALFFGSRWSGGWIFGGSAMAAMAGFLMPGYVLSSLRNRNHEQIRDGLPDVLDLLLVCSDAGLGLDMSIDRVGNELTLTQPLLSKHLKRIGSELRAGRSRADALRGFSDRTGTLETISLVRLLIQADIQGTSIAAALRIYADELRSHRILRAEERAHSMAAKLSIVLVGSFLPALFIAIGAPVVFRVFAALAGIHK